MIKIISSLLVLNVLLQFVYAQELTQKWVSRYSGSNTMTDEINSMVVDDSGYVYVTGYSNEMFGRDITTIKYNATGGQVWKKTFNDTAANSNDEGNQILIDNQGNIYVIGYSNSTPTHDRYFTIKYDANGVTQWERYYKPAISPGSQSKALYAVCDTVGNIIIAGKANNLDSNNYDIFLIKYGSVGDTLATYLYDGPDIGNQGTDNLIDMAIDNADNVYLLLETQKPDYESDITLIKMPSTLADTIWTQTYDGGVLGNDAPTHMAIDNSNNIFITGYSENMFFDKDIVTIKYNSDGDELWVNRYNGPYDADDLKSDIVVDHAGNICIIGESIISYPYRTYFLQKYSTNGDTIWTKHFSNIHQMFGGATSKPWPLIAVDDNNNIFAYMLSDIYTSTSPDYYLVQLNANGEIIWSTTFNGIVNLFSSNDAVNVITTDQYGSFYLAGYSQGFSATADYTAIKYCVPPVAAFGYEVSSDTVTFIDSSAYGLSYSWDFGDSTTSNLAAPMNIYSDTGYFDVCLTVSNSCDAKTVCKMIYIDGSLIVNPSVKNISLEQLHIYPNPVTDIVYINIPANFEEGATIYLTDILGRNLFLSTNTISKNKLSINFIEVPKGVYYLRLINSNHVEITQKLVKL